MKGVLQKGEAVLVWLRDNPPVQGNEQHVRGEVVAVSKCGVRLDMGDGRVPIAIPVGNITLVEVVTQSASAPATPPSNPVSGNRNSLNPSAGGSSRPPQYDDFWRSRLGSIEQGLGAVADGAPVQSIDVSGLTEKGKRPKAKWNGKIRASATGFTGGEGEAHVKSLGRVLIAEKVLQKWPDKLFGLSVNGKGDTLTIKRADAPDV